MILWIESRIFRFVFFIFKGVDKMGLTKVGFSKGVSKYNDSGRCKVPTPEEDVRPKCFQHLRPIGGYEWLEMSLEEYNSNEHTFEADSFDEDLINENLQYTYVARILTRDECCGEILEFNHIDVRVNDCQRSQDGLDVWRNLLIIGVVYSTNTVRYIRKFVGNLNNSVLFSDAITNIFDNCGTTLRFDYLMQSSYTEDCNYKDLHGYYRTLIPLGITQKYAFSGNTYNAYKEVAEVHAEVVTEKTFNAFQFELLKMHRANAVKQFVKRNRDILFTISDFRVRNEEVYNCLILVYLKDELYYDFRYSTMSVDLSCLTFVTEVGEGLCSCIFCSNGVALSSISSIYMTTKEFTETYWNDIILPETIKRIDGFAFYNAKQEFLSLPDSVEYVDTNAFYGSDVNLKISHELDEKLKKLECEDFYKHVGDVMWK